MKRIVPVLAALMVMSHPAPAQVTPWQWVNPLPQGNLLNSIWASSTDTAVSVGDLNDLKNHERRPDLECAVQRRGDYRPAVRSAVRHEQCRMGGGRIGEDLENDGRRDHLGYP